MGWLNKWFGGARASEFDSLRNQLANQTEALNELVRESALDLTGDIVDPRMPYFDDGEIWLPLGADGRRTLPAQSLDQIRSECRALSETNGYAINGHENRINYVIDQGHKYKAVVKQGREVSKELLQRVQETLDEWAWSSRWGLRQQEMLRRYDRDGEVFVRVFEVDGDIQVRFVEPEHVKPPKSTSDEKWSHGVYNVPGDAETAARFGVEDEIVGAEEIQHRKANVDANVKRGLPLFYPVRKHLRWADTISANVEKLIGIQTSIAMIRKHANGVNKAGVQSLVDNQADYTYTNQQTGRTDNYQQMRGGRIIDASGNIDYEFPAAKVVADGAIRARDGILRTVASRLCMPEFFLSSDSSLTNFASAMVAEGPAVRFFGRMQATQIIYDLEIIWRMLRLKIAAGVMPEEVESLVEVQVERPTLAVRDRLAEAQANAIELENGVLSRQTWSQRVGLDYDQEQENIEQHAKEHPPAVDPTMQGLGLPGEETQRDGVSEAVLAYLRESHA